MLQVFFCLFLSCPIPSMANGIVFRFRMPGLFFCQTSSDYSPLLLFSNSPQT